LAKVGRGEARWRRLLLVKRQIKANTLARRTMTFSAKTNLVGVVDEGKVVCTKPIVAEDEVRVAGHVEFYEGGLPVKAAEDQTG
jgi:hypothetical protein